MADMPLPDARDLYCVIDSLEQQLEILDEVGAGIAAIHVNAAIEQLRTNIAVVNEESLSPFDPDLLCLAPAIAPAI